jgi:predicted MPP superfamily phosphohydrolase
MRGERWTGAKGALRAVAGLATGISAVGAAVVGYGLFQGEAFTLTRRDVPVLAPDAAPLRILHLSDLHATPGQAAKFQWLGELARLVPDLVVLTGDVLAHADASEPLRRALEPLFGFPGAFVPGNNDYYVPTFRSPHHYLLRHPPREKGPPLDWAGFASDLAAASGWHDMTHVHTVVTLGARRLDVRGVDDARSRRDRVERVAGRPAPGVDLALGLSHTPEPRVLDAFAASGVQLVLAGHTHGGQIRLPFLGALVTNCGIDRARAWGLSRWEVTMPAVGGAAAEVRSAWLHVSSGLGTSPYAPIRLGCPPEATLLTLVPARPR